MPGWKANPTGADLGIPDGGIREVELILEDSSFLVKTGGSLYFACDRKHVYHNVGETRRYST